MFSLSVNNFDDVDIWKLSITRYYPFLQCISYVFLIVFIDFHCLFYWEEVQIDLVLKHILVIVHVTKNNGA